MFVYSAAELTNGQLEPEKKGRAFMPTLDRQDSIFVLDLGDGENRFHPDWLACVNAGLDEVEKADGPRALVSAATGKFLLQRPGSGLAVRPPRPAPGLRRLRPGTLRARAVAAGDHGGRPAGTYLRRRGDVLPGARLPRHARRPRLLVPTGGRHQHPVHPRHGRPHPGPADAADRARGHAPPHADMAGPRRQPPASSTRRLAEDAVRATALELASAQVNRAGDTLGTIKARMYALVLAALRDTTTTLG